MLLTDMRKSMRGIVGRLPATPTIPHSKEPFHWLFVDQKKNHWLHSVEDIFGTSGCDKADCLYMRLGRPSLMVCTSHFIPLTITVDVVS